MRTAKTWMVLGLLIGTQVVQLRGQVKGADQPPSYRGFFPGMSRIQLLHAARTGNLAVECAPLSVYPGFPVLCQTPGTLERMGANQPLTQVLVLAPVDTTGHAGFVMILEPLLGNRTQEWLNERKAEWGTPSNGPDERIQWLREPYIAIVQLDEQYRFTFVGYLDVMLDVYQRGTAIHDSQSTRGH
jgi:hypothetical protein